MVKAAKEIIIRLRIMMIMIKLVDQTLIIFLSEKLKWENRKNNENQKELTVKDKQQKKKEIKGGLKKEQLSLLKMSLKILITQIKLTIIILKLNDKVFLSSEKSKKNKNLW